MIALALKHWKLVAIGALGLALLATGGLLKLEKARHDKTRLELAIAVDANASNMRTIADLEATNKDWADRHREDLARAERAKAAAQERAEILAAHLKRTESELEAAYATDDCDEWARARMCRAVADRLWRDQDRHPD